MCHVDQCVVLCCVGEQIAGDMLCADHNFDIAQVIRFFRSKVGLSLYLLCVFFCQTCILISLVQGQMNEYDGRKLKEEELLPNNYRYEINCH